ncbi:hypothetical protein Tco_1548470 [Tanacetum coccineum]
MKSCTKFSNGMIPCTMKDKPLVLPSGRTQRLDSGVRVVRECQKHFRINISQLSVIEAAKVSHFEILCRVYGITPTVGLFRCFYVNSKKNGWISFIKRSDKSLVCYTKPLDSLKNWIDHFFWVDDFACPARFSWHTAKNVTKDLAPAAADFNAQDYATLVAHPSPFRKFSEEFLCLVGLSRHYTLDEETYPLFLDKDGEDMDIFAFIHTPDPSKVKVVERERKEDKPRLLETTVDRTVPLLPVAPDRGESELDANVDKLFDEGGSGTQTKQGDSAGDGGGQGINIQPVTETIDTVAEAVVPLQPRLPKKRKTIVADAGGPSYPPKKLREDHGTPSGPSIAGKSMSVVQRLLVGAVLNVEVRGEPIPTLPFVTSSVSATPEYSSHHSGANIAEAEVDSFARPSFSVITTATTITSTADPTVTVKEKIVKPSIFSADSTSTGGTDPAMGGFTDLTGSDLLVGGIRTVVDPESALHKVYVPQWNVTNGSHLDDGGVCREMVDEFAPLKFFASVRGMEQDQLFTEFNVRAARQMSLSTEVRMRAEYNIREKRRLESVVKEKDALVKARDEEIRNLKAQLLLKEAEAAEAIRLRTEASKFEAVEKSLQGEVEALKERNITLEKEKNDLDMKVTDLTASVAVREREVADLDTQLTSVKSQNDNLVDWVQGIFRWTSRKSHSLYTDFVEMALHLEEKLYSHLLTTISDRRWLLTHGMELAISKCLNSIEYLSALGAAIGKAVEKGMQDGLSAGIIHGTEGRYFSNVDAYNPSAEADYISALQRLQSVNFSLLAELKSNKDASIDTLINILRLEDTLAERLGLTGLQPHVDQLMVPIHHSLDRVVVGASALSLSLDVSSSCIRKIKENIANHRSTLCDVFFPLAKPLSVIALTCTEGTSGVVPAAADTTTTLSTTLASTSTVTPISVDDYEVTGTDDQAAANENVTGGNVNPFPNVDDEKLNVPE